MVVQGLLPHKKPVPASAFVLDLRLFWPQAAALWALPRWLTFPFQIFAKHWGGRPGAWSHSRWISITALPSWTNAPYTKYGVLVTHIPELSKSNYPWQSIIFFWGGGQVAPTRQCFSEVCKWSGLHQILRGNFNTAELLMIQFFSGAV